MQNRNHPVQMKKINSFLMNKKPTLLQQQFILHRSSRAEIGNLNK